MVFFALNLPWEAVAELDRNIDLFTENMSGVLEMQSPDNSINNSIMHDEVDWNGRDRADDSPVWSSDLQMPNLVG